MINITERIYPNNLKPLDFNFSQNKDDFFVEEKPINFTNKGAFLILKIKKTDKSTWELIDHLSKFLRIYTNEIGYAGLKDKRATTISYISIPKKYGKEINNFKHKNIEILETFLHSSKLNIGDLKGNNFKINLYNIDFNSLMQIEKILKKISKKGMPNYFGYQRFGKDYQKNLLAAKEIVYEDKTVKDKKIYKMLISLYQSNFFNSWLKTRILLNKSDDFKLLNGDIFYNFEKDNFFNIDNINDKTLENFKNKLIAPTGLLPGRKINRSSKDAYEIEKDYDNHDIYEKGYRRPAIIFPKDISCKYDKENSKCTLSFTLPKSSYATVLIEYLYNKNPIN